MPVRDHIYALDPNGRRCRADYKRNADILAGIEKADRARRQLGDDVMAVVITDGYRGDYATRRLALERRVAAGTLEDWGRWRRL